jgi:hypothetical protein
MGKYGNMGKLCRKYDGKHEHSRNVGDDGNIIFDGNIRLNFPYCFKITIVCHVCQTGLGA